MNNNNINKREFSVLEELTIKDGLKLTEYRVKHLQKMMHITEGTESYSHYANQLQLAINEVNDLTLLRTKLIKELEIFINSIDKDLGSVDYQDEINELKSNIDYMSIEELQHNAELLQKFLND
ncbi:MAG: hypothetical protein ACRCXZ_03285 [Patescibacteria group bacterium]